MTVKDLRGLMQQRREFVFDLDGTLIDSSRCHEMAFLETLRSHRPELVQGFDYYRYRGLDTGSVFVDIGVERASDRVFLTEAKQDHYFRQVKAGHVYPIRGAKRLLDGLASLGRRCFVVTGGSNRSSTAVLESTGLAKYFSGMVSGSEGLPGKPAPDLFLACLCRFGLCKEDTVVIEDAASGLESAQAAALSVIIVNNPKLAGVPQYAGSLMNLWRALVCCDGSHD